eukprot:TRINITY_DN329_c0_g1_i1.p2 TRINITY_DN329_c0_g1~~TRINITY_DN329_c0_g1_i1.p2  ORF type:complete len:158 (-),score=34.37 TRINITY_DN329_c0_g1_i1:238-711(-)
MKASSGSKVAVPKHPKYEAMIYEAVKTLKERTGSSSQAIAKYLGSKKEWDLPSNYPKQLSQQLKRLVADGKLKKVKASYKLAVDVKSPAKKKTVVKKTAVAKAKVKKAASKPAVKAVKKVAAKTAKKPVVKKAAKPAKKVIKKTVKPAAKKTPAKKA